MLRYETVRERLRAVAASLAPRHGTRTVRWLLAPADLAVLVVRALGDERVPAALRARMAAAVFYLLSPFDLVPESLFGPAGLIDDATVLCWLADALLNELPPEVLREHWPGAPSDLAALQPVARRARRLFSLGLGPGLRSLLADASRALCSRCRHVAAAAHGALATLRTRAAGG